jgi:hypothetical protein
MRSEKLCRKRYRLQRALAVAPVSTRVLVKGCRTRDLLHLVLSPWRFVRLSSCSFWLP